MEPVHPILAATSAIGEELKAVSGVNPTFMAVSDKATALRELVALEARLTELRLRIMATAGDVAETTAARDAAGWLATETRSHPRHSAADLTLATSLDLDHLLLATAMRDGEVNLAQARVIATTLSRLPDDVGAAIIAKAEGHLVDLAADYGPPELVRLSRRILEVVAPEIAEEAEARQLAELEANAAQKVRLRLRRLGDGTTRISGRVPDASASRLAAYLEAFTSPRKQPGEKAPKDPVTRLPYPRRLGQAFCSLLEAVDPKRLPVHGGDATTVIVTLSIDSLRKELGAADLVGGQVPGEGEGDRLSASEVRRLACSAQIIPAVLGGKSEVLDLGRAQRLFSRAQRKALIVRDKTCRAEGCDVPGTWAEAHHWIPWSQGGETNLDDAVLLCSHHHHRAHDANFRAERLPTGDIRFHRRR